MNCQSKQKGFSLVETVIAIGILGTVVGSMIAMQSSVIRILQFSTEKQKASLILKSSMAQLEFLLSKDGIKALPEPDEPNVWESKLNPRFTNTILTTEPEIKLSQFLLSALQIYYMGQDENSNPELIKLIFTAVGDNLDKSLKEDAAIYIDTSISWQEGKESRKMTESIFYINSDAIESFQLFN